MAWWKGLDLVPHEDSWSRKRRPLQRLLRVCGTVRLWKDCYQAHECLWSGEVVTEEKGWKAAGESTACQRAQARTIWLESCQPGPLTSFSTLFM